MPDLPSVLSADDLLDKAFRRASKATAKGKDRATKTRNLAVARVTSAGQVLEAGLRGYVKGFPSLDRLPPFTRELADILVGLDGLKKDLGAIDWAAGTVGSITRDYARRIGRAPVRDAGRLKTEAFGRFASVVKQVRAHLDGLIEARRRLRRLPSLDPNVPTIVVAGYPNVGKSALVRAVSTGKPRVAEYPFTTKAVSVGHIEGRAGRVQILDTPGLLDRPMEARNPIERQAIAALAHVADVVLFLLDPTQTCGYPIDAQVRLLEAAKAAFPGVPFVVAENKADLPGPTFGHPRVSALTGEGLPTLLDGILERLTSRGPGAGPRRGGP